MRGRVFVSRAARDMLEAGHPAARHRFATTSEDRVIGGEGLLDLLVCPLTKGPLEFDNARQELISRSAKLAYPIRDGIPIMLPEEARKID